MVYLTKSSSTLLRNLTQRSLIFNLVILFNTATNSADIIQKKQVGGL